MVELIDVVVIGGGQAGLATSYELTQAGVEHVVLERGRIGQSWRGRWDSFCLVTPNWTLQLPGHPYDGDDPDGFSKHNPIDLVGKWKTPMLVIHGRQDYRVVDTQGMATFTALQRRGIPSRFVYFTDENHWITKPQDMVPGSKMTFAGLSEAQDRTDLIAYLLLSTGYKP